MSTKFEQLEPKYMFEELGFEYEYKKVDNCEDSIVYHKDNLHIQFNLYSKGIVFQNDTSCMFYGRGIFFVNEKLLMVINKQVEELRWLNE